ncbi:hypothetical protein ASG43_19035 [Aureimonas sp. Leaf454]|uniref:MarR family winged helix-turn-helix transcriptional regulator n=1 Tax=Aureimonas sp. Leaf454 TaxID=1736381 RepID=UPI0006FFE88C|nr:MarR family transcriptional regulator [Aureimonas sp. Leaf454]KQT53308.1 hypothetical protein ASG43_19035 [Aureimonas sp. Leaf454]
MSDTETKSRPTAPKVAIGEAGLVSLLLSISKSTRALTSIKLAEMGFHNGQDELLLALDEEAPTSVSRIADELRVRPSTVSKMLDRLVAKGLVERQGDKRDARRTMVRITPAGLDAKSRLLEVRASLEKELATPLAENGASVVTGLETVANLLAARLSRLR